MFVTTKLGAEIKSYQEAVVSIAGLLHTLGLDYIDLMVIHSPQPWEEYYSAEKADRYFEGNRAEKYKVSVPQLAIRYCLELGLLPLPKTANPKNMKNNAAVNFSISADDMEILKSL